MAKLQEIWKDIPGFDGFYQASNLGRIKSLSRKPRGVLYPERILIGGRNPQGYSIMCLSMHGKVSYHTRHRLVAITFIPNPYSLPEVNHIDGNKMNCCVNNLEWCTSSQNKVHAFATGLRSQYGSDNPGSKEVLDTTTGMRYGSAKEAFKASGKREYSNFCKSIRSGKARFIYA